MTTRFAGGDSARLHALNVASVKVMIITIAVLAVLLSIQFTRRRYIASVYWANIVVISLVGTQITDQFEGNGDVPNNMWAITIVSVSLLATGTAVGDLIAEKFSLGYLATLLLFVVVIAVIATVWKLTKVNAVLAFWLAYIMTRPLGASAGDFLSQKGNQGLNLGTSVTSYVFLVAIVVLVIFLQMRKPDITPVEEAFADEIHHPHVPHLHTETHLESDA